MQKYVSFKTILLFVFGLLLVIHGIKGDEKAPPTTLQIGKSSQVDVSITAGIKHHVSEDECTRKSKVGDKLKMHYQ